MDKSILDKIVKDELAALFETSRADIRDMVARRLLPDLRRLARKEIERQLDQLCRPGDETPAARRDNTEDARKPDTTAAVKNNGEGKYLYCILDHTRRAPFEAEGINKEPVRKVVYEDIGALVHDCPSAPYQSEDRAQVEQWVLAHQAVVDKAWNRFGAVIPATFDTVIAGKNGETACQALENWLKDEYDDLKIKIEKFRSCAEYGIQVSWDIEMMTERIARENREIKEVQEKIRSGARGTAYMYKNRIEALIQKALSREAEHYFREFHDTITPFARQVKIEKIKPPEQKNTRMIINLACLVQADQVTPLGDALEAIDNMAAFHVRFTGPWPPYSFASA